MKNIPVFMAQNGTATLILQEIPHRGIAYILLRTIHDNGISALIAEAVAFCHSCGAETCYVSPGDNDVIPNLPHAYDILMLSVEKSKLPMINKPATLLPISPDNDSIYQRIYNLCFKHTSHALTYDRSQIARIYRNEQHAFIALDSTGSACGIGELHDSTLAAVGLLPEYRGGGQDLTLTLLAHCPGPDVTLTVVSDNTAALKMYQKLGFAIIGVESSWFLAM